MSINWPEGTQTLPSKVIQVVSTNYTGVHSMSGSYSTVSGLSTNITMEVSSNRILCIVHMGVLSYNGNTVTLDLQRNGVSFYQGNASNSRPRISHRSDGRRSGDNNHGFGVVCIGYDAPNTTSTRTYTVRMNGEGSNQTGYVNRTMNDLNTSSQNGARTASSMTLIEYQP